MTRFDTRLIPPDDKPILQPVQPVWRPAFVQLGILVVMALVILLLSGRTTLGTNERTGLGVLLALMPPGLWLIFAWRGERKAQRPRPKLLSVLLLSMLVGNATTFPFIELVVEPDIWLAGAGLVTRVAGLMLTVGLVTEFSKLAVLRLLVWPGAFEQRSDAVAYGLAAGLGMAVVANLRYVLLFDGGQPGAAAIHIVAVTLMQQCVSLIIANGLMVQKIGKAWPVGLALHLLGGAFLHGLYAVIRVGVVVRGFGVGAAANSPLFGLVFAGVFAALVYGVVAFLMANADARDVQLASGPGEVRFMGDLE